MIVKESFYMRKFCISLAPFFIAKTYIVMTYYFTGQPCWDDIIESTVTGRMQKEHGRAATQWLLQNVYNTHFHTVGDKQQLDFKNEASFCKGPSNCIEEQHDCLIYLIVCFEHGDTAALKWLMCTCMHGYVWKWCTGTNSYSVDNENEKCNKKLL